MNVSLENDYLKVRINEKGAELNSLISKDTGLEYMWSGDPAFWGKTSPILFPIVGTLKKDSYSYQNKLYKLSRHGFARDSTFQIVAQQEDSVIFSLSSTPASREKYPFDFELQIGYQLIEDNLEVNYMVENTGPDVLYFSIGAHPAFKVPLVKGTAYEDQYLEFNETENSGRWPIVAEGLIKNAPIPFLRHTSILKLTRTLFNEDALVFKDLKSDKISIKSKGACAWIGFSFWRLPISWNMGSQECGFCLYRTLVWHCRFGIA